MRTAVWCLVFGVWCFVFGVGCPVFSKHQTPNTKHQAAGDNWPGFRGPDGNGLSDSTGLPITWSEKQNIVWKTAIHDKGWSSPVVWGDQVWLTTALEDGTQQFAVCVDRNSGKVIHDIKLFDVQQQFDVRKFNSYASPTPAIEEGRVYLHFGGSGTACLDTKTGMKVWERRDLPSREERGAGSSPVLHGDNLYLVYDGFDRQYLVCLDKKTGKTVWKRDRDVDFGTDNGDSRKAFATPQVITVDGKEQLVAPGAVWTQALDPKSGDEVWRVKTGGMNAAARPIYAHGLVFANSSDGGFGLFAVRPGKGELGADRVAWKGAKGAPKRASPVLLDDLLYAANDTGTLTCLEAKSGDVVWQQRLGNSPFIASPVAAEGRIYCFNEAGDGYVVAAGPTFKKLAANKLDTGGRASPAVAGKALFVRTFTHLYRIEQK
jgi:outer membrane protein assembly factor BamB